MSAQDSLSIPEDPEARISIVDFARIYSSDPDFNAQIENGKIEVINAEKIYVAHNFEAVNKTVSKKKKNLKKSKPLSDKNEDKKIAESSKSKSQDLKSKDQFVFKNPGTNEFYRQNTLSKQVFTSPGYNVLKFFCLLSNVNSSALSVLLLSRKKNTFSCGFSERNIVLTSFFTRPPPKFS